MVRPTSSSAAVRARARAARAWARAGATSGTAAASDGRAGASGPLPASGDASASHATMPSPVAIIGRSSVRVEEGPLLLRRALLERDGQLSILRSAQGHALGEGLV